MPAWRSASTQSAAIAMLGAWVSRIMARSGGAGLRALGALGVAVEAPRIAVQGDAPPRAALFGGAHLGPALHFVERAPATLALRIALAGRADRDARRVRRRLVPRLPCRISFRRD